MNIEDFEDDAIDYANDETEMMSEHDRNLVWDMLKNAFLAGAEKAIDQ